jgi:hypothetical protein
MSDLTESHLALARITDALFCSDLETGNLPTGRQLAAAIRGALKTHRDWNGCTRAVAAAFTKNPLAAEQRELWCHQLAQNALQGADLCVDGDLAS